MGQPEERDESMGPLLVAAARCVDAPEALVGEL